MNQEFKPQLRVLIVENNPVDAAMLRGMLAKSSYGSFAVESRASLAEALGLLTEQPFDVVLLDLNLNDSNGLDTLKAVHSRFPHIPIVVNTGVYHDDLGLQAVTRGAQDYLIKGKYLPYGLTKSLYYAVERKRAETELKNAYERLRETQGQLIQAEKIHVVGGLASGIAHEVKNPLATILYGIEFLYTRLECRDEKIQLTLESIKEAATKANLIIKDLLDFASLSVLQKNDENINELVNQSLSLVRHQCEQCGITIKRRLGKGLPLVRVDRNRIEQVLLDLILNAVYAMKGGGDLVISTHLKEFAPEDNGWLVNQGWGIRMGEPVVVVDIDDQGDGIKDGDLDKIFDPFFTTRRAAGGVGLGLAIARTIMNNHHGYIQVANRDSGGARARLIFRAAHAEIDSAGDGAAATKGMP